VFARHKMRCVKGRGVVRIPMTGIPVCALSVQQAVNSVSYHNRLLVSQRPGFGEGAKLSGRYCLHNSRNKEYNQ